MFDRVTITGADDATDPLWMLDMSLSYPNLEWGILVSRSREGSPRYPSREWQEKLLKISHRMNLSMHACGKWAREIFRGDLDWAELPPIRTAAQRIQINGTPATMSVDALMACHPGMQFIVQYPRAADWMYMAQRAGFKCVPLFDESGGEGRQVRAWSDLNCEYVGFAGGIGPDDVVESVGTIRAMRTNPFWIDAEGRMREDERDVLDTRKVERMLELCDGIANGVGFGELVDVAARRVEERKC